MRDDKKEQNPKNFILIYLCYDLPGINLKHEIYSITKLN